MKTILTVLITLSVSLLSCEKTTEKKPECQEFTLECELKKTWSAINILSNDSTSYDGFGNPLRKGWYLYNSISKQVFPLSVISYTGETTGMGNTVPAHSLGEDGAGSMTQLRNWGVQWKKERLKTNVLSMPGVGFQEIEVLCLSGGEISFLQFTGNEVAGKWNKYLTLTNTGINY